MSSTGESSGSGGQGGWGGGSKNYKTKEERNMSMKFILAMICIIEYYGSTFGLLLTDCKTRRDINEWIEFIRSFIHDPSHPIRNITEDQGIASQVLLDDLLNQRNITASGGNFTRAEESDSEDILEAAAITLLTLRDSGESSLDKDRRSRKEATEKFYEVQARILEQKPKSLKVSRGRNAKLERTAQRIIGELKEEFYSDEIAAILKRIGELNENGNDSEDVSPPDEHSHGKFKRLHPDDSDPDGGAAAFGIV